MEGTPTRQVVGVTWGPQAPLPYIPAVLDFDSGVITPMPWQANEFAGECVPVAKIAPSSDSSKGAYGLSIVSTEHGSELRGYETTASGSQHEMFRAWLPHAVPF